MSCFRIYRGSANWKKNGEAVKFLKTPRFVLNNHLLILQFPKEANGDVDIIQHTLPFRGVF